MQLVATERLRQRRKALDATYVGDTYKFVLSIAVLARQLKLTSLYEPFNQKANQIVVPELKFLGSVLLTIQAGCDRVLIVAFEQARQELSVFGKKQAALTQATHAACGEHFSGLQRRPCYCCLGMVQFRWCQQPYTLEKGLAVLDLLNMAGHTAAVLDGRKVADIWQQELALRVAVVHKTLGRAPGLGVVLVGSRPDSRLYVLRKQEACVKVGIKVLLHHVPESVSQAELVSIVRQTCNDSSIDGVLVQLPLPQHLDEEAILEAFDPSKDVDGFHPLNMGRMLMRGRAKGFVPCTALGVMELIARSGITLQGKRAVVIGDSNVVGTPLAMLLRDSGVAALTVCHRSSYQDFVDRAAISRQQQEQARLQEDVCLPNVPGPDTYSLSSAKTAAEGSMAQEVQQAQHGIDVKSAANLNETKDGALQDGSGGEQAKSADAASLHDLPAITRTADIVIVAVGHAELVRQDWIKPGAVVIDVGINVVGDVDSPHYYVVGDVAAAEVAEVASAISPVPGGVGPMTIAAVLSNTIQSAEGVVI